MKFKAFSILAVSGLLLAASCKKKDDPILDTQQEHTDPSETVTGFITTNTTWTNDKVWILDGKVVVSAGATLTIEAGTIIKGKEGINTLASALIIEKGAYIIANGSATDPIIFTSVLDNIKIGQKTGSNLDEDDQGKWGGVIVLGNAPVSVDGSDIVGQIEGIPANDTYGSYGGSNATDSSGILNYISIRHGGAVIGSGNEINGLTLGGVGSGTTITNIEVVSNVDDGIEFFGGTVNVTNAIVSYQGDDAFDLDQNYAGTLNNIVVIQKSGSDEGFEFDGPEGSTYTTGKFTVNNATVRSVDGGGKAADLKSKAQGTINNTLFEGFSTWVRVRENYDANNGCADKTDAFDYVLSDDLVITNCVFLNANSLADAVDGYNNEATNCPNSLTTANQTTLDTKVATLNNSTTGTTGANEAVFSSWTWTSVNGKL